MGNAKRRGTLEERKANPLGKKPNHFKGIFDLGKNRMNQAFSYLRDKAMREAREKLRGN